MAHNNSIEMLKKRLMAEFARDKKKAVILIVLLLVAVLFVGKLLLKSAPAEATAAANPATVVATGAPMAPGREAGSIDAQVFNSKNPEVEAPKVAANAITRDIFMPNPSIFPEIIKKTTGPRGSKVDVVEDEKSKRDAELKRKEALIREQGAALHLESTITGRRPIAIINGTVLGPGGLINGFRIVEINSQACVVEKDGVRLNLTME